MGEQQRMDCIWIGQWIFESSAFQELTSRLGAAGGWSYFVLLAWTKANCPNGSLITVPPLEVEAASQWDGENGAFVFELLRTGLLQKDFKLSNWNRISRGEEDDSDAG